MTKKTARRFACVLLALVAACSNADPAGPPLTPEAQAGTAAVQFGTTPNRLARDPYRIEEATIDGDTLRVRVTHGGGCERHEYGFIAYDGWLESFPVQVNAMILHDAKKDACDALLTANLRFSLAPLRAAYTSAYRTEHGTVIIRLNDPASPGQVLRTLSFSF